MQYGTHLNIRLSGVSLRGFLVGKTMLCSNQASYYLELKHQSVKHNHFQMGKGPPNKSGKPFLKTNT